MATGLERVLDGLRGFSGPISPENRERLRRAVLEPSPETWEAAYSLVVDAEHTVWQLVKTLDPDCPTAVGFTAIATDRWGGYFPDSFTLRRALSLAGDDTNASSHG